MSRAGGLLRGAGLRNRVRCLRRGARHRSGQLLTALTDDRGSTIPLILGFFLIGLLVVAGAVLASDALTRQRDLQSVCDGAAVAGANAIDAPAARTRELATGLPLAAVQAAVQRYLAEDAARVNVRVEAGLVADGSTVLAVCHRHTRPAFAGLIGHPDGLDQHAESQARGVLQ